MNSKVKSALRSTLQQENQSLESRLPEPAAPVAVDPAVVNVAAAPAPALASTPDVVAVAPAEVPAAAAPAPVEVPAKVVAKPAPAPAAKPAAAKRAPAVAKAVKTPAVKAKVESKPVAVVTEVPVPAAPVKKAKSVKAEKPVKADKAEKVTEKPAEKIAKAPKQAKAPKIEKPTKASREKVVRDSFSMPKSEHAQLKTLRETLAKAGRICTKSELLRAGVQLLLKESPASTRALVERLSVVPKGKSTK